ncbi:unnamed protein product [Symbiodinium sp. CCMP2592]|nr:unnamed protein product [Symbiodinium sp. CCMP2592]
MLGRRSQTSSQASSLDQEVPCERQDSGPSQCSSRDSAPSPGHSMESGASVTDLHMEAMIPTLAERVAKMDVVNPEVLRVTPVFRALERFAVALRVDSAGDFFHKSHRSQQISTFWSHSWHGGHWKKILTIVTLYNGTAAVVLSLLTGACMMMLFSVGNLPGIDRGWWDDSFLWSCWSTFSGFVVACLAMMFWRPRTGVFLDRICISQNDARLKTEAIFSLAGLLKNSDRMLILWDPTWTERLWCLFELAAFLKSKTSRQQHLIVRPIFMGPLTIAVYLTFAAFAMPIATVPVDTERTILQMLSAIVLCMLVVAVPTASTIRSYFRDLDTMKLQLSSISVDSTRSSCCDLNHLSSSGERMLCDRKIVKECVKTWFGSELAFEDTVRTEVSDILNRDLTQKVFSTPWALGVSSPVILAFMDLSASWTQPPNIWALWDHPALCLLAEGLLTWFLVPANKDLLILLLRLGRRRPRSPFLELLKNLSVLSAAAIPVLVLIAAYGFTRFTDQVFFELTTSSAFFRLVSYACCTLLIALCNYFLGLGLKALLRRPGW